MKIAALDLGTNSFLCLIAEIMKNGTIKVLQDEMRIVRLGQELGKTGRLHPDALVRARECLEEFSAIIRKHKVDLTQAVATAAAREAQNSFEFLDICTHLQIPIVTISGEEEALMSFQGALPPQEKDKVLLIDIGGGSTEYTVGTKQKIDFAKSLPYGAVKLTEAWILNQPTPQDEEKGLRNFVKTQTEDVWAQIQKLKPEKVIAVAGTPTALGAAVIGKFDVNKIEGMKLSKDVLSEWIDKLRDMTIEEKKIQFGARADVIFAGVIILDELLNRLNFHEIIVSTKGIRYGLAYKMAATIC